MLIYDGCESADVAALHILVLQFAEIARLPSNGAGGVGGVKSLCCRTVSTGMQMQNVGGRAVRVDK